MASKTAILLRTCDSLGKSVQLVQNAVVNELKLGHTEEAARLMAELGYAVERFKRGCQDASRHIDQRHFDQGKEGGSPTLV